MLNIRNPVGFIFPFKGKKILIKQKSNLKKNKKKDSNKINHVESEVTPNGILRGGWVKCHMCNQD